MAEVNAAVIGTGNMGQHHARHYSSFSDVKLVAISDTDKAKAALAKRYGCKFYTNYREMLEKEKLDCVSVVVPTTFHKEVAMEVLSHGIHALVEKPISYDLSSANEMIKTARKNNVKLMIGHIERFNPAIRKLKTMADSGDLGEILSIEAKRLAIYHPRIRDSGIIIDLGIHDIDLMNYLLNEKVKTIYAVANRKIVPNPDFEDYANLILTFKNGSTGRIEMSWISPTKIRELNITGSKICCKVNTIEQRIEVTEGFLDTKNHLTWEDYQEFLKKFSPKSKIIQEKNVEPLSIELREFIDSIKYGKAVPVSGEDATEALRIALLAIKSYKESKIIKLQN